MEATFYHEYGSADVLELKDIDKPLFKDNEVLVRVHAASVNRLDWHLMRGSPHIARLQAGLRKPKDSVLGADVTGQVEAVGKHVTKFRPGDEVFGSLFGQRLVVDRKTNREIAEALFLSPKTVETHMRNIFRKLDVSSRVEVARVVERADRSTNERSHPLSQRRGAFA
jgi:NADPH:quinone reductase-like Zn-dependent oxidoreductase